MATTEKSYRITSLDGEDSNGVRAEVSVQVGHSLIESIEIHRNGHTAAINMVPPNPKLKFPIRGNIPLNMEIYNTIKECYEKGVPIDYRIETQRKKGIDRSKPIDDLDKNTERIAKFVGINGVLSEEALTDPEEDEKFLTADPNKGVSAIQQRKEREKKQAMQTTPAMQQSNPPRPNVAFAKKWRATVAPFGEFLKIAINEGMIVDQSPAGSKNRLLVVSASKDFLDVVDVVISRTHPDQSGGGSDFSVATRSIAYSIIENLLPLTKEVLTDKEARRTWKNTLFAYVMETVICFDNIVSGNIDPFTLLEDKSGSFLIPLESSPGEISKGSPTTGAQEARRLLKLCEETNVLPEKVTYLIKATYGVDKVAGISKEEMNKFLDAYENDHDSFVWAVEEAEKMSDDK